MTDLFDQPSRRQARAKNKSRRRVRTLIAVAVSAVVVVAAALWAYPAVRDLFDGTPDDYEGPGTGEIIVEIPQGSAGTTIGELLEEKNVVASKEAFVAAYNAQPEASSIQAGAYRLQLEMKASAVVAALLDPAHRAELTITVPEGYIAAQVYERVSTTLEIPLEDVQEAAEDASAIGLPGEADGNIEGWLAPATYPFPPSVTPTQVLSAMVSKTVSNLNEAGVPADQWHEVLVKASIVEREGLPQYFGQVARVIENRLSNEDSGTNGRLQMDATVNYGLGNIGGVPTQDDLREDTPYNTYLHAGLPPTPIGSPSIEAIKAVLNPEEGDWLYFTTVNLETGETKFASTLEEHLVNVEELRQWRDANPVEEED